MPVITQPKKDPEVVEATQSQQTSVSEDMLVDEPVVTDATKPPPQNARPQIRTPSPQTQVSQHVFHPPGNVSDDQRSPGHIPTFDWDEFESRYERALSEANQQERELLEEFERLFKARCIMAPFPIP
jgi:hypothetical protein